MTKPAASGLTILLPVDVDAVHAAVSEADRLIGQLCWTCREAASIFREGFATLTAIDRVVARDAKRVELTPEFAVLLAALRTAVAFADQPKAGPAVEAAATMRPMRRQSTSKRSSNAKQQARRPRRPAKPG